jgi:hypothetical protein
MTGDANIATFIITLQGGEGRAADVVTLAMRIPLHIRQM